MTEHHCLTGIDGAWGCVAECPSLRPLSIYDEHGGAYDADLLTILNGDQ